MRKLIMALAVAIAGLGIGSVTAHADPPQSIDDCRTWTGTASSNPDWSEGWAFCLNPAARNIMYRVHVVLIRRSDGEVRHFWGDWKSCALDVSKRSWRKALWIVWQVEVGVQPDTLADGC